MTILELIQKTTQYFEKAGVPNPRLDVELLLSHALGLKRMELYIQFERNLSEAELNLLRPLVKRRANREPLQHIVGHVDFCDLNLLVSPQALIPRPETEILVAKAVELIGKNFNGKILDLGTGTGAIILSLLKACPAASGIAVDLSESALELAKKNAAKTGSDARIEFRKGNFFEAVKPDETFDLIISNPPYIPSGEMSSLQKEVQLDPVLALDGGADGLDCIRSIVKTAPKHLKANGLLLLETGINQKDAVDKLFQDAGLKNIEFFKDLQQVPRLAKAQKGS